MNPSEKERIDTLKQLSTEVFELCNTVRMSTAAAVRLGEASALVKQAAVLLADDRWQGMVSQSHPPLEMKDKDFFSEPLKNRRAPEDIMPHSPFIGTVNPVSPRFVFTIEEPGKKVTARGLMPELYAGPPGSVHGGIIAGLFDELLGTVCWSGDRGGFTGTLNVRYVKPTPLGRELHARGECTRTDGRKTFISGWLYHEEVLTATAEGIFIRPRKNI